MTEQRSSLEAGAKCIRLTEMLGEMLAELRVAQAQMVGWLEGLMGSMRVVVDGSPTEPSR
jgi:hypothetical protein